MAHLRADAIAHYALPSWPRRFVPERLQHTTEPVLHMCLSVDGAEPLHRQQHKYREHSCVACHRPGYRSCIAWARYTVAPASPQVAYPYMSRQVDREAVDSD